MFEINNKGGNGQIKCFDQLWGVRSTQKLVEIHMEFEINLNVMSPTRGKKMK